MDVIHTAIWVSDLEEARAFFEEALGLEENGVYPIDGVENIYLGGDHGNIQLKYAPDGPDPDPDRTTIDHIAVSVDDVNAMTEQLVAETDCRVIDEPYSMAATNNRIAFVEGPDGYVVELVEDLG